MRLGRHKFRDRMSQGRIWADVEDRERVFAIVHSASGQDDRNEMDTCIV